MNQFKINPESINENILLIALGFLSNNRELENFKVKNDLRAKLENNQKIDALRFITNKNLPKFSKVVDVAFKGITKVQSEIPLIKHEYRKMTNEFSYSRSNRKMSVGIVGSGISGIIAAYHCVRAGFQTTIYERESNFGGTWNYKIYPGARCDVQGNLYTYANHQNLFDSPYLSHDQIKEYLDKSIKKFDLLETIQFSTSVIGAIWKETAKVWQLELRSKLDTISRYVQHNFLIVSTGQLDALNAPKIANTSLFGGKIIHANKWPNSLEIRNSKVCLVGSGATSSQLLTQLVKDGNYVNYSFRTPAYFANVPYYRKKFDEDWFNIFNSSPLYRDAFRIMKFSESINGNLEQVKKDGSLELQDQLRASMSDKLKGREDLIKLLIPKYPLGAKRILLDDGSFFNAINSNEVRIIKDLPAEYYSDGLIFQDGTVASADYVVLATGFNAAKMFTNFPLTGLKESLKDYWGEEPKAYLGIMVPTFPNLFLMFGPNTNVVVNGSNTFMAECQAEFIVNQLISVAESSAQVIMVQENTIKDWQNYISSKNMEFNWSQTDVPSWYVNRFGKSFTNFPGSLIDYFNLTTRQEQDAFEIF